MKQILEGMNFLHKKWIIHRVKFLKIYPGHQTFKYIDGQKW